MGATLAGRSDLAVAADLNVPSPGHRSEDRSRALRDDEDDDHDRHDESKDEAAHDMALMRVGSGHDGVGDRALRSPAGAPLVATALQRRAATMTRP